MSAFIFTRHRSAERSAKKNLAAGRFCLALILCAAHVTNAAQDQPNIVFILTDPTKRTQCARDVRDVALPFPFLAREEHARIILNAVPTSFLL